MPLYKELQQTVVELSKARKKSRFRLNEFHFIRTRVINIVRRVFQADDWERILRSLDNLPHRLSSCCSGRSQSQRVEDMIAQHIVDDMTSVLMKLANHPGELDALFVSDRAFARDIYLKHAHGWFDTCADCGQSLHLHFDLCQKAVVITNKYRNQSRRIKCLYQADSWTQFTLNIPSKKLVVSDSLNQFVLDNNRLLAEKYDLFATQQLRHIDSTSRYGNRLVTEFYERFNLGCLYINKGPLVVHKYEESTLLSRGIPDSGLFEGVEETKSGLDVIDNLQVGSLYLSMMDYGEFLGLCNQCASSSQQVLESLNAAVVDVPAENISVTKHEYSAESHSLLVVITDIEDNVKRIDHLSLPQNQTLTPATKELYSESSPAASMKSAVSFK